MYVYGRSVLCGQVGEFAVDATHRSLGPAVMLQRVMFGPVDSGELAVCYDCPPDQRGMSPFVRLGMQPRCRLIRYVALLRIDEVVARILGAAAWTKPLVRSGNLLLNTRRQNHQVAGLEISVLSGWFGDEFTYLDQIVPSSGVIRASRAAELLNWRFRRRNGIRSGDVDVVLARKRGELLAFLAFSVDKNGRASIHDLFGCKLREVGLPLLTAALEMCRRKKLISLEAYCSESSELKPFFEAAGFRARERDVRVVAYSKSDSCASGSNSNPMWNVGPAELYP